MKAKRKKKKNPSVCQSAPGARPIQLLSPLWLAVTEERGGALKLSERYRVVSQKDDALTSALWKKKEEMFG